MNLAAETETGLSLIGEPGSDLDGSARFKAILYILDSILLKWENQSLSRVRY